MVKENRKGYLNDYGAKCFIAGMITMGLALLIPFCSFVFVKDLSQWLFNIPESSATLVSAMFLLFWMFVGGLDMLINDIEETIKKHIIDDKNFEKRKVK
jgi:energy-coupling factor transporter transmembrane protein EcfT